MGSIVTRYQEHIQSKFESHNDFTEYQKTRCVKFTRKVRKQMEIRSNDILHTIIFYSPFMNKENVKNRVIYWLYTDPRIDVNSRNTIGWTPLHYAAMVDNIDVYIQLLKCRADTTAITHTKFADLNMKNENTIRDIAVYFKSKRILNFINEIV